MSVVVKILCNMDNNRKYSNSLRKSFFKSPEYLEAYTNYIKSKNGEMDALQMFVDSIGNSAANAIKYGLGLPLQKGLKKEIDNAVKEAAIATGGTWTD